MLIEKNKSYFWQLNEQYCNEENFILNKYNVPKFFNYIDQNLINRVTLDCINLGNSNNKCSEFYGLMNFYNIDPFIQIWEKSLRQTVYFRELNYIDQKYWNSNIPVGKVINQERSSKFNINNGIYRSIPIDKEWEYVCVWGTEKKDFDFNQQFDIRKPDGKWFFKLEKELLMYIVNFLFKDIRNNKIKLKKF